ncbi:unnamed protein product, partial [Closterium sp. Naga37s-1]
PNPLPTSPPTPLWPGRCCVGASYVHVSLAGQVLVLHNVYVNLAGQVFNETHLFDHNACAVTLAAANFRYASGRTRVRRFKELVSLVDWFAWSARAYLLELIPLFVSLRKVMPAMRGVAVAVGHRLTHRRNQMQQMVALGAEDILGVQLSRMNVHVLQGADLFFAEKLILVRFKEGGRGWVCPGGVGVRFGGLGCHWVEWGGMGLGGRWFMCTSPPFTAYSPVIPWSTSLSLSSQPSAAMRPTLLQTSLPSLIRITPASNAATNRPMRHSTTTHAHHCMPTTACPPLHSHHCMVTTAWSPLHSHHCMVTTAFPPLHGHHCMVTTAWSPLHSHHCMVTTAFPPLHGHHCIPTTAWSSLHSHHCMVTTAFPPLHGHHCIPTTAWSPLHSHHCMVTTAFPPLHGHHCIPTTAWSPLHFHHCMVTTAFPPLHGHHCIPTTAWSPLHSHHCMVTTAFPPLHGHHCIPTTAWSPLHSHHCMVTTAFPPLHGHHCIPTTAWSSLHSHHCMVTTAFPPLHSHHCIPTTAFPPLHSHHCIPTTAFPPLHAPLPPPLVSPSSGEPPLWPPHPSLLQLHMPLSSPIPPPDYRPTAVAENPPPKDSFMPRNDWVVLLGWKNSREELLKSLRLKEQLEELFPADRVLVYREGAHSIPRRKDLLNRAHLLVAPHDNLLADLVFMPPGAAVVEIRPVDDPDPVFHLLADVCDMEYYLAFSEPVDSKGKGKAGKGGEVALRAKDPKAVERLLKEISRKVLAKVEQLKHV